MPEVQRAAQALWDFHCVYDTLVPSDVIIGLGSYDTRVASRCAELFQRGLAPHIIFTGASGNWTQALFPDSEAKSFQAQAIANGVPKKAIVVEPHAKNIGENIQFSAKLVPSAQRVILVTKPQTQRRCAATAQKQWPAVQSLVTAPKTTFEDQPLAHHDMRALICEMVGDLERIRRYPALGFQAEVNIPPHVSRAFDALINAGFVDHLQT
ncbi:DUF218 domain-containing protein [Yoonia maricola]|uniref:DUF218 domain-containing protein n=1 Tax=Yoonia maricola TaxID=420999 RepID=A0A2M8W2E2_9RHOB|nr:DUF218 domain-containing protein [Yoonia maricola]